MKAQFSAPVLAIAFAVAMVSIATLRGETKETSNEQICSTLSWPMIPTNCIEGGALHPVRFVGADVDAFDAEESAETQEALADMQVRFAADFE